MSKDQEPRKLNALEDSVSTLWYLLGVAAIVLLGLMILVGTITDPRPAPLPQHSTSSKNFVDVMNFVVHQTIEKVRPQLQVTEDCEDCAAFGFMPRETKWMCRGKQKDRCFELLTRISQQEFDENTRIGEFLKSPCTYMLDIDADWKMFNAINGTLTEFGCTATGSDGPLHLYLRDKEGQIYGSYDRGSSK